MDNIAHVWFVDTHTKRNGCNNHIDLLHKEVVLVLGSCCSIHTCVVGVCANMVGAEQLGKLLHLFAAQTVDDARLALVGLDVADDFALGINLGTQLVVEVGSVER